ncbi:MAG TPA: class I SAM-dependent methyltransferase [Parafilimonas sp.]|nr:class I SAM-dependent methyltransferase [Parafilimonas sp.]
MEQSSVRVFSNNWNIYEKIRHANYMHHAEFATQTADALKSFNGKHLHILDIGCGDAKALLPVLEQVTVASYTGYDLSPNTLQLAEGHLTGRNFGYSLQQGDMMQLLQSDEKKYDLIYSAFAIHHLHDKEKRKLLQLCFAHLTPGGKMVYMDIFRAQQMSREQYIERYLSMIRNDWQVLSENEKQLLCEHISEYDFPADTEISIEWMQFLGFTLEQRYQPDAYHAMLVLSGE